MTNECNINASEFVDNFGVNELTFSYESHFQKNISSGYIRFRVVGNNVETTSGADRNALNNAIPTTMTNRDFVVLKNIFSGCNYLFDGVLFTFERI